MIPGRADHIDNDMVVKPGNFHDIAPNFTFSQIS